MEEGDGRRGMGRWQAGRQAGRGAAVLVYHVQSGRSRRLPYHYLREVSAPPTFISAVPHSLGNEQIVPCSSSANVSTPVALI